jgi:hypothetical protein
VNNLKITYACRRVRHADRKSAEIAQKRANFPGLTVYRCLDCRGWHLAKKRKNAPKTPKNSEIPDV